MFFVKGPAGSAIANRAELGLSDTDARITIVPIQQDVRVNAWGDAPVDVQRKGAYAEIRANLIQYDPAVLQECIRLTMGGGGFGRLSRAGSLIGNGVGRLLAGNDYFGLDITSPISGLPWNFLYCFLYSPIGDFSQGTNPGTVAVTFRCIPYTPDPWQGGAGASEWPLFTRTLEA